MYEVKLVAVVMLIALVVILSKAIFTSEAKEVEEKYLRLRIEWLERELGAK